jgi:hypothetical protein
VVVPQIALLLEPFNEATIVLQGCLAATTWLLPGSSCWQQLLPGSNYVTGSLMLPTISSLHKVTFPGEDMLDDDNCVVRMHPSISAGRLTLHEDIQRRFMENMDVSKVEDFALATVLDPRFKWLDFPHLDQWLDGTLTKEMVLAWLRGAWHDPVEQWIPAIVAIPSEGTSAADVSPEDADATRGKRKRGLFGCMAPTSDAAMVGGTATPTIDQRQQYLALPQMPFHTTDVLEWWRGQRHVFPDLSRMACQYLAAPASSAGVERLFSRAGRYHDDMKKSTTDEHIETLLIVAKNTL